MSSLTKSKQVPPNIRQPRGPNKYSLPIKERQEEYLRTVNHEQIRQYPAGSVPSTASSNPHDMNKQGVLSSQPQIISNIYNSVTNQHSQSGMPGPNHGSSTLVQSPQGLQSRNQSQSNMQAYFGGRSNASASYGLSRTAAMNVATSANAHYSGQLAMYAAAASQNLYGSHVTPSGAMIIPPMTTLQYSQNQYQPHQYPSQPVMYRSSGNSTSYYNTSGTVYYPSAVNMAVSRTGINSMGATTTATPPPPKREKKIITISDEAGRDLTEEILSKAKNDVSSSNASSSQPNEIGQINNISVAAQFAEQVAAVVKGPSKTPPLVPASQSVNTIVEKEADESEQCRADVKKFDSTMKSTVIKNEESELKTPPPLISPNQISSGNIEIKLQLQQQELENIPNEKPETFSLIDDIDSHNFSLSKVVENSIENDELPVPTECIAKPVSVPSSSTVVVDIAAVVEKLENMKTCAVLSETDLQEHRESIVNTSERLETDVQSEADIIPSHHNKADSLKISVQNNIDSNADVEKTLPLENENQEIESVVKVDQEIESVCVKVDIMEVALSDKEITLSGETDPSSINQSQMNDKKQSEENKIKENGAISITSEIMQEVKERKNKGKKWKEINKRGETKGGDDMDAFIDKSDNINQSLSSSSLSPTCTSPIPEMVFTSSKIEAEISALEEERKVAEKNEENKRVSMQAENSVDEKDVTEPVPCKLDSSLKYNYSEDQWSPINLEGKKKYDRAFLLNMQGEPLCLQKPKNLPEVEIVKEKAILQKLPDTTRMPVTQLQLPNRPDPFMPNYARSRPPPGGVNRRQSQQGKEKVKRVITMPGSLTQDVKLHACDNAWKANNSNKKHADDDPGEVETKELYKKVTGILNKLTPQKFHTLVEQAKHLNIDTEARLRGVMDLVFEKAVDEPNFSVPYANMCKQIALIKVPKAEHSGNEKEKDVNFKKLLLMKCQREFERDSTDEFKNAERIAQIEKAETEEMKKQLQEEHAEEERKSRHRSLGNIKFIGELFKLNMLTAPIMHECMRKLFRQGDDDSLECLCRLLTTIGKELEAEKSKSGNKLPSMDSYFEKMQTIVNERKTSSRVRFMLQDIIELKHNNWVPRRDENNPKTIDQIHREAEREAQQQQQLLQQTTFTKRPTDDRNIGRKNRNTPTYTGDDGWSMHSNKSKTTIDPSKLKISKAANLDAGNLQLGQGFAKWGQGSSGGQAKVTKQDSDTKPTVLSQNRYSALLVDQNPSSYEPRRGSQRSAASSRESSRSGASNLPPPPVRKTSSQTSTKERKQTVEAVKDITRPDSQKQRLHNSVQALEPVTKETNTVLQGKNLTEEEMESKTKPLIDEFLHNNDIREAIACVIETVSSTTAPVFISAAISHVLERSSQGRRLVGQLTHHLVKKKIITLDSYVVGLKYVLETADDCAIDVPKIWQYLGELIEPMIQDDTISLVFLKETAQPCVASGTGGKLISEVLHAAAKNQGNIRVAELWKASGLQWSDFLSKTENVFDFVKQNNLEFIVGDFKVEPSAEELSLDCIKTELDSLLQRKVDNEAILDWIVAHVRERVKNPKFIRALTTSLVESAIEGDVSISSFDKKKLTPRVPLLQRYVDQNVDLELQVVFALQTLVNQLEHPKGLLRELFQFFFDEDLISEDAFTQWEQNNDPAEQEGKGVALKSVTSFITWIREQEEDSLDDN